MSSIHWICLLFLFADVRQRVESAKPSIKLSFSPDEPYLPRDQPIDIQCELLNPTEKTESPQLWYVDLKTGKRTAISRLLLTSPNADAPEVFKTIKNHRLEFLRKNHMRIRRLQLEDSARYECDCPDCEEVIPKQSRDLFVMKLSEPRWIIEPELPLHENTQATIKCQVEDFFPYVRHQILRNDQEMTSDGKTTLPTSPIYPQKFLWERTFEPKADWHNTTIRCLVTEGNSEQQAIQTLEVLFAPRFLECHERQHINPNHDIAQIECSYSGNPAPTFMWRRLTDQRIITPEPGITIETKDEHNGRYKAILKLNRTKLTSMPVTAQTNVTHHENYFQEIVNGGFLGQLTINGVEKDKRTIHVDRNVNQARASSKSRADFSTSISPSLVFLLLLIGTCLRWHSTSSLH